MMAKATMATAKAPPAILSPNMAWESIAPNTIADRRSTRAITGRRNVSTRQRDGAELVDGDVAHRDRGSLRQQQRDAIPAPDAAGGERVGEAVRGLAQRAVAHLFHRALGAQVENGGARGIDLGPAVADVDADIVARRDLPAERLVERAVVARGGKDVASVHRSAG